MPIMLPAELKKALEKQSPRTSEEMLTQALRQQDLMRELTKPSESDKSAPSPIGREKMDAA